MVLPLMLTILIFLTALLMVYSKPLTTGLVLLMMVLMITMTMGYLLSPLLSLMLFMVYIGGIMMMFAYFISAAPNTKLTSEMRMTKILATLFIFLTPSTLGTPSQMLLALTTSQELTMLTPLTTPQISTILFLMLTLLFTMMIVIKISTMNATPMRPFK